MANSRMNRLTDRQVAVLAAVERLGRPTLPDVAAEFPHLAPSAILSTLDALEAKKRVFSGGEREWVYLGEGGFGGPKIASEAIVRFWSGPASR